MKFLSFNQLLKTVPYNKYSCNNSKSDLPDIYTRSPRAEGVYIRKTMSAHVTSIMCHLVIGYKPTYVANNIVANIKPTSTTTPYPLGYEYNCEMI